jgi:hypothetical protein
VIERIRVGRHGKTVVELIPETPEDDARIEELGRADEVDFGHSFFAENLEDFVGAPSVRRIKAPDCSTS